MLVTLETCGEGLKIRFRESSGLLLSALKPIPKKYIINVLGEEKLWDGRRALNSGFLLQRNEFLFIYLLHATVEYRHFHSLPLFL